VILTGDYGNSCKFNSTTTISGADSSEIFFASYDKSGNFRWVLKASGPGDGSVGKDKEWGLSVATDPSGNVIGSGTYRSNSTFGNTSLAAWANTDIYITKISQTSTGGRMALPVLQPADSASYCIGGFVNLETSFDSTAEYRWMKDGRFLENASGNNYRVTSPGVYNVQVIHGEDSLYSGATKVTETKKIISSIAVPDKIFCRDSNNVLSANIGDGYIYQWKRNGRNIKGANSYSIAASREGKYQVKVIQGSCFDWSAITKVDFSQCDINDTTMAKGIETNVFDNGEDSLLMVKIYPNPNNGMFTIEINMVHSDDDKQDVKVEVVNSLGQIFYEKIIPGNQHQISEQVTLGSSVRTGIYFLRVSIGDNVEKNKIMLIR